MWKRWFSYKSLDALRADAAALGVDGDVEFDDTPDAALERVTIAGRTLANRLAIHPMEGCDGTADGEPGELTLRRWRRFGAGGAALIWGEATAVLPEGRANPRQLLITPERIGVYARLVRETRAAHREAFGHDRDLLVGLQLTHSGRYSHARPVIAAHNPALDARTFVDRARGITVDAAYPLISDADIERLEDAYARAARCAAEAGFDFIDVKHCHGYLPHELLGARSRPGLYGGSFENRTRFARNTLAKIRAEVGRALLLAARVNVFDGVPYVADPATGIGVPGPFPVPYIHAFGVNPDDPLHEDLDEPLAFARLLAAEGVELLNVSLGIPYINPHLGRPFDRPSGGSYLPPEHPLLGVARHFRLTAAVQRAFPDLAVVGTGYSWLQRWLVHAAAANIRKGAVTIAGVGRGALAYPDFARDAREKGVLDSKRVCLAVSFCTDLMRAKNNEAGQYPTGCVPRDAMYADLYAESIGRPTGAQSDKNTPAPDAPALDTQEPDE